MVNSINKTIWAGAIIFVLCNVAVVFFLNSTQAFGWLIGYLLGMMTVMFHLASSVYFKKYAQKDFISYYYTALLIRFFIVCALFLLILLVTKIDEFSFTVSFIISYIFHSVIEVIFLHQKLSNETSI